MGDWLIDPIAKVHRIEAALQEIGRRQAERDARIAELRQVCSRQVEIIQRYRAYLGRIGFAVGTLPAGTEPTPVEATVARLVKAALEGEGS